MKLKRNAGWSTRKENQLYTIAGALRRQLDNADSYGGAVENAASNAEAAIRYLGDLTQKLHERGVLSDADVLELLGGKMYWSKDES